MASTPFRHVSWTEEPITAAKLQQMASNDEYLLDNLIRASYRQHSGVTKNSNLKILSGNVYLAANKKESRSANVYFGNFFSTGCRPMVTATVCSYPVQRIVCNIHGIGNIVNPDSRGFVVYAWAANREARNAKILHGIYVNWTAVGY